MSMPGGMSNGANPPTRPVFVLPGENVPEASMVLSDEPDNTSRLTVTVPPSLPGLYALDDQVAGGTVERLPDGAARWSALVSPVTAFFARYVGLTCVRSGIPVVFPGVSDNLRAWLGTTADAVDVPRISLVDGMLVENPTAPPLGPYGAFHAQVNARRGRHGEWIIPSSRILDVVDLSARLPFSLPMRLDTPVVAYAHQPIPGVRRAGMTELGAVPIGVLRYVESNRQGGATRRKKGTLADKFQAVGAASLGDLLVRFPHSYIDKTHPASMDDLVVGEQVTVAGEITESGEIFSGRGGSRFVVADGSGATVRAMFFNQRWLLSKFSVGDRVVITGKFNRWNHLAQVSGTTIDHDSGPQVVPIVPVYPQSMTKGVSSTMVLNAVRETLARIPHVADDRTWMRDIHWPGDGPMTLDAALRGVHLPRTLDEQARCARWISFRELVSLQLVLRSGMGDDRATRTGIPLPSDAPVVLVEDALSHLPFRLTDSQQSAFTQVSRMLSKDRPADILLNADVGAGKGLAVGTAVSTPAGPVPVESLTVGMQVCGSAGTPTLLAGVFHRGPQPVARLHLSDGTSIVTDLEHRWGLVDGRVVTTGMLLSTGEHPRIPVLSGPVVYTSPKNRRWRGEPSLCADLAADLVAGTLSEGAFHMSVREREALVGAVAPLCASRLSPGGIEVDVPEGQARTDFARLIRELGGVAVMGVGHVTISGVRLTPNGPLSPVRSRWISSVEMLDSPQDTVCLQVDAPDELFVAGDTVVTHNTVVSQLACLQAVGGGFQAAVVAPTDMLARQLFRSFGGLSSSMDSPVRLGFLSSSQTVEQRRAVRTQASHGELDVLVGTHSVTSAKFANLGLVCVDEQQKFSVGQREKLLTESRKDGRVPHLLTMSATPIPRSLAKVAYGGAQMVHMNGKPPGRLPVKTVWVKERPDDFLSQLSNGVWADVCTELDRGGKVFIVAPCVVDSPKIDAASVEATYAAVTGGPLSGGYRVGVVHGQMKSGEQVATVEAFRDGQLNVLVASTIIEVGLDVPSATRVVVLSADRLGAATLHQVRGRVGRSDNSPSVCYLVSAGATESSRRRLQAMVDSDDGLDVAAADLWTRGEGRVLGSAQSGASDLSFSDLSQLSEEVIDSSIAVCDTILASPDRDIAVSDAAERFRPGQ